MRQSDNRIADSEHCPAAAAERTRWRPHPVRRLVVHPVARGTARTLEPV